MNQENRQQALAKRTQVLPNLLVQVLLPKRRIQLILAVARKVKITRQKSQKPSANRPKNQSRKKPKPKISANQVSRLAKHPVAKQTQLLPNHLVRVRLPKRRIRQVLLPARKVSLNGQKSNLNQPKNHLRKKSNPPKVGRRANRKQTIAKQILASRVRAVQVHPKREIQRVQPAQKVNQKRQKFNSKKQSTKSQIKTTASK